MTCQRNEFQTQNGALENGNESSLILDVRSIELGASCSEFSKNAKSSWITERYPNSLEGLLPCEIVLEDPRLDASVFFVPTRIRGNGNYFA